MKIIAKVVLVLMTILTVICASVVVYVNANSSGHNPLYAAFEYESAAPPADWYTPEQLGIVQIIEYGENGSYWLHVAVENEPFPLQSEQPVFQYENKFYQISPLWVTPGLSEQVRQLQIPIMGALGTGWLFAGVLLFKKRERG